MDATELPNDMAERAEAEIEMVARVTLDVATLDTRQSGALDFHDLAVWQVRAALTAAYAAGFLAGRDYERTH